MNKKDELDKLLCCPCCGEKVEMEKFTDTKQWWIRIKCKCGIELITHAEITKEAIKKITDVWNKRVA